MTCFYDCHESAKPASCRQIKRITQESRKQIAIVAFNIQINLNSGDMRVKRQDYLGLDGSCDSFAIKIILSNRTVFA